MLCNHTRTEAAESTCAGIRVKPGGAGGGVPTNTTERDAPPTLTFGPMSVCVMDCMLGES
jgi:hypothetical protein